MKRGRKKTTKRNNTFQSSHWQSSSTLRKWGKKYASNPSEEICASQFPWNLISTMILFSAEHLSVAIFWHRKTFSRAKSIPSSCARLQKSSFYHLGRNLLSTYMQKMLSSWKMFNTKQQKITLPRKPFYF